MANKMFPPGGESVGGFHFPARQTFNRRRKTLSEVIPQCCVKKEGNAMNEYFANYSISAFACRYPSAAGAVRAIDGNDPRNSDRSKRCRRYQCNCGGRRGTEHRASSAQLATNDSGIFVFPDLPIGTYSLRIAAAGFAHAEPARPRSAHRPDHRSAHPTDGWRAKRQEMTVTSETQQIQTSTSTVEQSVSQQQMRDLPLNGRNPLQLTTLTAGAVLTTTRHRERPGR